MEKKMAEILDCTLRDGGYYTNWEFSDLFLEKYFKIVKRLSIKNIELGYCNPANNTYKGEFFYCHPTTVNFAKTRLNLDVNLWLMIDFKYFVCEADIKSRLMRYSGEIFGIRITVPPDANIAELSKLVDTIKECNLSVSMNFMYSHFYVEDFSKFQGFQPLLYEADVISFVDSYGLLKPWEISGLVAKVKDHFPNLTLGFHGHNNLELALANALTVKDEINFVDATIGGLGRGAGNVRTELAYLTFSDGSKQLNKEAAEGLCWIEETLASLKNEFKWGAEIPYAIAAFNKMPQANVMHLMSLNRLSYLEIVNFSNISTIKDIVKNNEISIEIPDARAGLCIAHSAHYKISSRKFKLINDKLNLKFVSFLGINSVIQHRSLISWIAQNFDTKVIVCVEGTSENIEYIKKISEKNLEVFLTPPILVDNHDFKVILPRMSLNNPLEIINTLISVEKMNLLVLEGFDGRNAELKAETNMLLDDFTQKGVSTLSLTKTDYSVPELQIFSI